MPSELTDEQIEAFLDSRPGWAMLSTIDGDGFPHTVPLGYFRLGRDIVMGVRDRTRKVANIEADAKVSVMVEDGSTMADIRGVMFQGRARIVREPDDRLQLSREGARLRGVPESEWPTEARPGVVYIRVTPTRTVSWDYSDSSGNRT